MLSIDPANNKKNLRDPWNPDEPLKIIYMRLNECVEYAALAGKPITEGQVIHIAYSLVAETGQSQ